MIFDLNVARRLSHELYTHTRVVDTAFLWVFIDVDDTLEWADTLDRKDALAIIERLVARHGIAPRDVIQRLSIPPSDLINIAATDLAPVVAADKARRAADACSIPFDYDEGESDNA